MNIGKNRKAWLEEVRKDFVQLRMSLRHVCTWTGWILVDSWRFVLGKEKR